MNLKDELILLDASVLLAAWGSDQGASWAVLRFHKVGVLKVIVTSQIVAEAKKNQGKVGHPYGGDIEELTGQFEILVLKDVKSTMEDQWRGRIADKDLHVLAAGFHYGAKYLLTHDVKDFSDPRLGELPFEVWLPGDFVRKLRETGSF